MIEGKLERVNGWGVIVISADTGELGVAGTRVVLSRRQAQRFRAEISLALGRCVCGRELNIFDNLETCPQCGVRFG